ncbi:MAG: adenylate/guanylate cyclase domain-containing protein [Bacteroidales bacterium]
MTIGKIHPEIIPALIILTSFLFLFPGKLFSQSNLPDTINTLWIKYKKVKDDSSKVVLLTNLAFFYHEYLEDEKKADSLADAAITVAEMSLHSASLIRAYNGYLESTDNALFYSKALGYANKALQISRITNNDVNRWRTNRNIAKVYLSRYDYNNAISASYEALSAANTLNNGSMIAESYLLIGGSNECKNQRIEAFRNYLYAADQAEKSGDSALMLKCYFELSRFYNDNNLFDEALEYKQREGEIIRNMKPIDSVAYMWVQFHWQFIIVRQKKGGINGDGVKKIVDFAIRRHLDKMKSWEFALYRKYLLESNEAGLLYHLYKTDYPGEFAKLYQSDLAMYYRLKAYFTELDKMPDSAHYYFKKAEQLVITTLNKKNIYQSTFYNRYGEFLIRQGKSRDAIEKFTISYNLCLADPFFGKFEFMLTASRYLEKLYREVGDYKNAWYYASVNITISDSINAIRNKDQFMAESVKREKSLKEMAAEKDRQKIRQGKNQLNMMAGGVVFLIVVSLLVFRNYWNQRRLNKMLDIAKKKSDDLLLNILPQETAEELKSTGKAKAKRFEEVTVMFTDFKDFTQASERMSAEMLVEEINVYFSEFDNIITRHNIEKIKIIGDSYMCAGGLPVANETHACDVVAAALEFQDFMTVRKKEKSAKGETFFELRIGIHTGPVVAGIVGHKKFAYDIWGDTVNTASRMENSGETNKVNISGETYEKVKEQFQCTYRGKVSAKHKGEIDMYFVNTKTA